MPFYTNLSELRPSIATSKLEGSNSSSLLQGGIFLSRLDILGYFMRSGGRSICMG